MKYTFLYMAGASLWNLFMTVLWLTLLLGCSEELHVPSPLRMRLGMGARGEQPSHLNEMLAFYITCTKICTVLHLHNTRHCSRLPFNICEKERIVVTGKTGTFPAMFVA